MVLSKLDRSIDYPEERKIDKTDIDYNASLYELDLLGVSCIIALGKPKYTFIEKNVIYIPIYFFKN